MARLKDKYNNPITIVILTGYLFLFGFNILHYHNYNVELQTSNAISNEAEPLPNASHFVHLDFKCPVHNTYTSLHNVLIYGSVTALSTFQEIEFLNLTTGYFHLKKDFYLSNALRAPPSLFS